MNALNSSWDEMFIFRPFFCFTNLLSRLLFYIRICICCFVLCASLPFYFSFFFAQNSLLSACAWYFFIQNPFVYFNLMQHAPTARYIIKYFSILFSRSFYEFSTMQMAKFHELEHSSVAPHILFYIVNFVLVVDICNTYTNTLIWLLYIIVIQCLLANVWKWTSKVMVRIQNGFYCYVISNDKRDSNRFCVCMCFIPFIVYLIIVTMRVC